MFWYILASEYRMELQTGSGTIGQGKQVHVSMLFQEPSSAEMIVSCNLKCLQQHQHDFNAVPDMPPVLCSCRAKSDCWLCVYKGLGLVCLPGSQLHVC